jgi:hypothetical protein
MGMGGLRIAQIPNGSQITSGGRQSNGHRLKQNPAKH